MEADPDDARSKKVLTLPEQFPGPCPCPRPRVER